jgi:energy-coupling factor transport system substrate-specific component
MSGAASRTWRLVDIVVAAVVAAAFGVAFVQWNLLYVSVTPLFSAFPAGQAILYGVWLLPGVLVALIVRRPGAALFGGLMSAAVSMLLGGVWGADTLLSGAIQGGGAELAFAIGLYRWWTLPAAILAGALAGLGAAIHDVIGYYPNAGLDFQLAFGVATVLSGALVAGVGAWLLVRTLAAAGVLRDFAAGGEQRRI